MKIKPLDITITTVGQGLPLVCIRDRGAASGIFGITVRAGSRDDDPDCHGLAHFVEHTIFKGTARRSAMQIINRMESVGGELNAYTTKEETVIYSIFPGASPARAAELIADLATGSVFPEAELTKEREVVADEIDSYLDTPSEAVFDDFEDMIFAGTPLGHNILGTVDALRTFDSDTCRRYLKRWYVAGNMVAFYSGPMSASRVATIVGRYLESIPAGTAYHELVTTATANTFDTRRNIDSHQAHTVIGSRLPDIHTPHRHAIALMVNILGGPGMNSLLNVALRERRGLVYSVEASSTLMTDTGLMTIYFGCAPHDTDRCKSLTTGIIADMAAGSIDARALARAKKQYAGQWAIACENRENTILAVARALLLTGTFAQRQDTLDAIEAVTPDEIARLAASLQLSSLTLD